MKKRAAHPRNSHLVDVRRLSPELQNAVRAELLARVAEPDYLMSYLEASRFYNVPYDSIKLYIYQGRIATVGTKKGNRRIAHGEMRRFLLTYDPRVNGRNLPILKVA